MEKSRYEKHLTDNITKIYKQSNNNLIMLMADKEDFNINPIVAWSTQTKVKSGKVQKHCGEYQWKGQRKVTLKLANRYIKCRRLVQIITDRKNCIFIQLDIEKFYALIRKS